MIEIASKLWKATSKKVLRQTTMYRFVCCQPKYIYILYCTFTDQRIYTINLPQSKLL